MQANKTKASNLALFLKAVTWQKDSHSLFDYQSNKINSNTFNFNAHTKNISLYRKRYFSTVLAVQSSQDVSIDHEECQFLTKFQIDPIGNGKFRFAINNQSSTKLKKTMSQRLNTDESNSVSLNEEQAYMIVRKLKDLNGDQKGCRLQPGQTLKLGRVEFFVSEVCIGEKVTSIKRKNQKIKTSKSMKYTPKDKKEEDDIRCKICLEQTDTKNNFLFNPCKCSGSCGTVHIQCMMQWIGVKVKKEVVGGTLHYNFQKFQCEVCKAELPLAIETQDNKIIEMLPIHKPKGNYMILEGACEKAKSVMMIQNVPELGIKLGRGHDCQIRITDISVSRTHAIIKFNGMGFYVYDNKSKFGTLVKQDSMVFQIGVDSQQAIQIGRTIVMLDVLKQCDLRGQKQTAQTKILVTNKKAK